MHTSIRLQVGMGIGIKKFWFPRGNRKHVFFTPVGTLAWPSRQSFHYRHWAVNIVESVRQDTIEYWQNKFKIRMRIYLVNDKTWDLLICFCGSITMAVFILEDALSGWFFCRKFAWNVYSQKICGKTYFNSNTMLVVLIACGYLTLMYQEQSFIKNVYGMSFDISEIILRVKPSYVRKIAFTCLCLRSRNVQKRSKFSQKMWRKT